MAAAAGSQELPVTVLKINGEKVAVLSMRGKDRVRSLKAAVVAIINTSLHQVDLLADCRQLGDDERLDRIERTVSLEGVPELVVTVVIANREVDYCPVDYFCEHDYVNIGIEDPHDVYAQQLEDQLEQEIVEDTNAQILPGFDMPLSSSCQQMVELQQNLENWRQRAQATTELQLPVTVMKINGEKVAVLPMGGNERVRSLKAAIVAIIHTPLHQVDLLADCRQLGNDERLDRIQPTVSPEGVPELVVTLVIANREVDYCPVDIFYENHVNIGIEDPHDIYEQHLEDQLEDEIANATDTNL